MSPRGELLPAGALESRLSPVWISAPRKLATTCSDWSPYLLLGSMCEFSLNSFQLMIPIASGDDASAALRE